MGKASKEEAARAALDFAPGLLAIQEQPPARLPRAVLHTVLGLCGVLLVWAVFGRLDIVASAAGRLVPQTYLKIVQPADAGVVREILVREGRTVEAGEVLIRLDATLSEADARVLGAELALKRLQLRRVDAELSDAALSIQSGDEPQLFGQVLNQYQARRQAYQDALAQERAVLGKTRHDGEAAQALLHKLQQTEPSYRQSARAFESLGKDGFYSALSVEEKRREHIQQTQDLQAQRAAVNGLRAALLASEKRLAQITSSYRSDLQSERIELQAQVQRLQEEANKLSHKSSQLVLRAPQRGIVKDLATHTPGTVVSPGTVLMTLVPHEEPLRAEVAVRNEDVGFVHEGQRVKVKLSAYPFQKYGMIDAVVAHLGPDAGEDAATGSAGGETQSNYKALVDLEQQFLEVDGRKLALAAGMQLVADIHLGRRTVMEYLLSPAQKAWQEAGRER